MCSLVGWAGNVSESIRFRIKINTILAEDYFGILLNPTKQPRFGNDFLPKGTRFRRTFVLRVRVFDACLCPKHIAGIRRTSQPAGQPACAPPVGCAGEVPESACFRIKINTVLVGDHLGISANV